MSNKKDVDINEFYTGDKSKRKYKRRKRSKFKVFWSKLATWKKVLLSITASLLAIILLLVAVAGIYINVILAKIERDKEFKKQDLGFENVIDKDVFNIALFGVDSRKVGDFSGLSDSMMILSVNKKDNTVKIVSLMRDSLVPIDGVGNTKLNTAYSKGGPSLAVKTINQIFGLDISAYATVNFFGMGDIIDAVGGIDIEVTEDELFAEKGLNELVEQHAKPLGKNPEDYKIYTAGVHHMNGIQAVAYARIRAVPNINGTSNDFGRTERQRIVMQKLMEKALSLEVSALPGLVNKLVPYVKTSLNNSELVSLATFLAGKPQLLQARVPGDDYIINADYRGTGASTVYYNYEYAGKLLHAFLYRGILPDDYIAQNGVDKTPWHVAYGGSANNTSSESTGENPIPSDPTGSENSSSEDGSSTDSSITSSSGEEGNGNGGTTSTPSTPTEGTTTNPEGTQ